ncbi:MAG: hypothetical protein KDA42_16085, partial [Planctomycetales bacterium]|nr:hypothetical protein [Planctomycetales bacterium]
MIQHPRQIDRRTTCLAMFALLLFAGPPATAQDNGQGASFELPDPAVDAILSSNPQTPAAILQATLSLTDLGRPQLARDMFGNLVKLKLNEGQQADLVEAAGSDKMFRLLALDNLGDEARKFASSALAAADKRARDPKRLAKLIELLQSESAETRRSALVDLKEGREAAVAALLAALADDDRAADHPLVASAILSLAPIAAGPIFGALETEQAGFKARVISLVPHVKIPGAAYYLIGPALDESQPDVRAAARRALQRMLGQSPPSKRVVEVLDRHILHLLTSPAPLDVDHAGNVVLWHWDDRKRSLSQQIVAAEKAGALLAARLARHLVALPAEFEGDRIAALAVILEADRVRVGNGAPLPTGPRDALSVAANLASHDIERILVRSMQLELPG